MKHAHNFKDLSGMRFGRLMVVQEATRTHDLDWTWDCICDCGNRVTVRGKALKAGSTVSCGCYHDECARMGTHKQTKTRLYGIWKAMRERCNCTTSSNYANYGGRGIAICGEWNDFCSFRTWAEATGYSDDLSIDRIDVNGDYCPQNCRWATFVEQQNNKRTNRLIDYKGKQYTFAQLAKKYEILPTTLRRRLNAGWSLEDALSIRPVVGNNQNLRREVS